MPGGSSCCDRWELSHPLPAGKVLCSLAGPHLTAGQRGARSLVLLVMVGVRRGALRWQDNPVWVILREKAGVWGWGGEHGEGWRPAAGAGAVPVPRGAVGKRAALPQLWEKETDFFWGNVYNVLHPRKLLNIPELGEYWEKDPLHPHPLQWHSRQGDRERFIFLSFCYSQQTDIFAVLRVTLFQYGGK